MTAYPALFGCLWVVVKVILSIVAYQVFDHFATDLVAYLILDRDWGAYQVVRHKGGIDMLVTLGLVWWIVGAQPSSDTRRGRG